MQQYLNHSDRKGNRCAGICRAYRGNGNRQSGSPDDVLPENLKDLKDARACVYKSFEIKQYQ